MELFWTRSMKERMNKGSDEKREEAMVYELKKIASLQKLKEQGGPFTSAEEVDAYLADLDDANMKEKQKRMLGTPQHCCQRLIHSSRSIKLM